MYVSTQVFPIYVGLTLFQNGGTKKKQFLSQLTHFGSLLAFQMVILTPNHFQHALNAL